MRERLSIGQVARRAGVKVDTLRYYEKRGLLSPSSREGPGAYRAFEGEAVRVVRFIKRAQTLGFSLAEIGDLLALRNPKTRARGRALPLARRRLEDVQQRLRELGALKAALEGLIKDCEATGSGGCCPILEALEPAMESEEKR